MIQKKKLRRKVISFVLALVMVLSTFTGIVPGTGITAYAENSNDGWVDCYPEDGEYLLVCKADPTKVLTYYNYSYQFSTYNGDPGQKWSLERLAEDKPSYKITFCGDYTMDVPCWDKDIKYGDSVSSVSYGSYYKFSEYETNVFRFSQRENGPSGQEYAIRVVSEAQGNYDYVLQGDVSAERGALNVGQYSDENTAQYWSFVPEETYIAGEHEHKIEYTQSENSVTATCTNEEGYCLLENKKSVLEIIPPSNISKVDGINDDDRKAQIVVSGDDVTKTKIFTNENTTVGEVIYYKATLDGTTYTKTGEALPGAPKEIGDYVAEVKVTVAGTDYALSTGYSILDRIIAGEDTTTSDILPTKTSNYNYSWTQQIYDKDEVGASGDITAIDFYNAGDTSTRNLEIYMVETDKETFTTGRDGWVPVSADSKVFSGEVTFQSGKWTTITFDTPFGYHNEKNLLLCVRDMTGSYNYEKVKFAAGETSSYKAIYAYNDDGAYDISNPDAFGYADATRNVIRLEIQDFTPATVTLTGGENATVSGGDQTQTVQAGAMTTVTYTANHGYYFKPFEDISNKGVTVTRTSDNVVTVSGIPEEDVTITIPDAVEKPTVSRTVTFKVVNGSWDEGEGDEATAAKTVTLTGYEDEELKLKAGQIPAVGTKPARDYKTGSWNPVPDTDTLISGNITYTYTYIKKDTASVTKEPVVKELAYSGEPLKLIEPALVEGGTICYAVTTENSEPDADAYKEGIPEGTDAGTYYVWYKVVGDGEHLNSPASYITAEISKAKAPSAINKDQKPTGKKNLVYTGTPLPLVTPPVSDLPAGYTIEYSTDDGVTWNTKVPTGTNAGDYTVKVRYKGDKNHEDFYGTDITVTIDKAASVTPNIKAETATPTVAQKNRDNLSINSRFKVTQKGSKITVKWGKVSGATGYKVYVAYCGKKFSKTPAKRATTKTSAVVTKVGGKKINLKKNFKVYVVAVKKDGSKTKILAKTITGHIVGRKNTKFTNAKSIKLKTKTINVSVGKTSKVKAKTNLVNKKKKQLSNAHAKEFRYASSDKSIATVDKNGNVKGVSAGTTTVYVYARNGLTKTVSVTVK